MIKVCVAGSTGWVGRALVAALARHDALRLAAAVSRSHAGQDAGEAVGLPALGVEVAGSLKEALETPFDVLIDYTKPHVVKAHALSALEHGRHVVVGTSGLGGADYEEIDAAARVAKRGVVAAGNFSITATLLKRFALEAAKYVADVEVIDYASAQKPDVPSGTGRELGELLAQARLEGTAKPVADLSGLRETRGASVGAPRAVQVHSVRMPSFTLSCEAIFGAADERLTLRHDAGGSAAPYVAGTLLAAREVVKRVGLTRGMDSLL